MKKRKKNPGSVRLKITGMVKSIMMPALPRSDTMVRIRVQDMEMRKGGGMWVLIVVLAVLTCPVWGGIGLGLLGALLGILLGILGLFVGLIAGGTGMVVGGIVWLVWTFAVQISAPATAAASAGGAILLIALGLLFVTVCLWLTVRIFPAVFRWFVDLIQRIFYRGRRGGDRT